MRQWFISELAESLVTTVHDVEMVVDYLSMRGDIDMDHIGMFGAGSGGSIAILAATADPRIRAIQVIDPWGDWPDWLAKSTLVPERERPLYLRPEFLKKLAALNPVRWLTRLEKRPIRLEKLSYDSGTPRIAKEALAAAASTASTVSYQDPKALRETALNGKLYDWLKEQLRSNSRSQTPGRALTPPP